MGGMFALPVIGAAPFNMAEYLILATIQGSSTMWPFTWPVISKGTTRLRRVPGHDLPDVGKTLLSAADGIRLSRLAAYVTSSLPIPSK